MFIRDIGCNLGTRLGELNQSSAGILLHFHCVMCVELDQILTVTIVLHTILLYYATGKWFTYYYLF